MEKIYLDGINLSKLHKVTGAVHSESTLFHDKKTLYKIFDHLDEDKLKRKQKKQNYLMKVKNCQ